ncbi:reductase [Streptomyces sulfonofaciens]|uniref:Reductase n=1 Tax=Streptomyces sulfonofaciens TaxID=68272 RepID=A0A919G6L7_9ACTN|nr:NAD(P)-dependent oxidoreductase [Streptomyces sulfonofaciens]GHH78980.1 reductase [Streptomyces sulfonofaciens]
MPGAAPRPAPPPKPYSVAVVGATGCLGRAACTAFAAQGHDVLAIARRHAPGVAARTFAALDLTDAAPAAVTDLLAAHGVDVLVNAAGGWVRTEAEMAGVHVRLVERLLAATAALPGRPRIVQVGSIHEYGRTVPGTSVDESAEPAPDTPYGRTKLAGARVLLDATREGAADGVVLRVVNVCGPGTTPASFLGAVTARLRAAAPGEPVELDIADARRDFVDVRDVADAVVRAAERPVTGRVVNIGSGTAVGMAELVALLVSAAGLPPGAVRIRGARAQSYSRGNDWTRADITLAADLLGWRPRVGLRESLRDMWRAAGD